MNVVVHAEITVKHCKSMCYEVEGVGSPGRTRTYNPPVNSRAVAFILVRLLMEQGQFFAFCSSGFMPLRAHLGAHPRVHRKERSTPSRLQSHTLKQYLTAFERRATAPIKRPNRKRAGIGADPHFLALRQQDSTRGFDIGIIPRSTRNFQVQSAVLVTGPYQRGSSEKTICSDITQSEFRGARTPSRIMHLFDSMASVRSNGHHSKICPTILRG